MSVAPTDLAAALHVELPSALSLGQIVKARVLKHYEGGRYLVSLEGAVARVAAGQFTREGIALVRNQCFIEFCESAGDHETASLYRDIIQPDERHHHEAGRTLLGIHAGSYEAQNQARRAALRTIELAEEIQEMARLRAGIMRAPGC